MRSFTAMTTALAATLLWTGAAGAAEPKAIPETDKSDYLFVHASHAEPKPSDPVSLRFEKLKITKVKFAKPVKEGLEGASAEFQIDLASLKSDSAKRDAHIKSPDYLDVAKFTTATVKIEKPRHLGGGRYKAPAKVSFRGKTYDWEVSFKVVETLPNGVRIRGEHKLNRKDVAVGKETGDSVGQELLVRLQLTLLKSK
ncbi:MAG TPA: YceI family protein [Kofleriaceae bacterium]|nr:YceI family protein [Kofleriaceae bacterium]